MVCVTLERVICQGTYPLASTREAFECLHWKHSLQSSSDVDISISFAWRVDPVHSVILYRFRGIDVERGVLSVRRYYGWNNSCGSQGMCSLYL